MYFFLYEYPDIENISVSTDGVAKLLKSIIQQRLVAQMPYQVKLWKNCADTLALILANDFNFP